MEKIGDSEDKPQEFQLIITLKQDGQCLITGPIYNRTLCYGMLEMAKEAIYEFKNQANKIKTPKVGILNFVRNLKGGH